jgi:GPH family glycoside/pentoside/hexuronide:cation symporter
VGFTIKWGIIMTQEEQKLDLGNSPKPISKKETILYGLGPLADQMSHQMFQFLIFTFYYAIVGITLSNLIIAFIIFALWDAVNDPIVGTITDKTTKTKMGKRKFWTLLSLIPFGLINIFIFTPPFFWTGNNGETINLIYMIVSIILYDTFYSFFSVSELSLFSEMFITEEERGKANMWKSILIIIGVIIGFVVPTIIIPNLAPTTQSAIEESRIYYFITGIMVCILVIISGYLFAKYGITEDRQDYRKQEEPKLREMLKDTLTNGKFMLFCIINMIKWTVFKLLTTIIPLWALRNLGVEGIMVSIVLLGAFLAAAAFFPLMRKIGLKIGWRNGFIFTQLFWAVALIPFWFFDGKPAFAIIGMIFVGIGLSGAIYFVEPIIANVIDEDELKTGKAKAGSFYGINGLVNRFSTIIVFVIIGIVLSNYGWEEYLVGSEVTAASLDALKYGIRLLLVPVSIIGNVVVALLLFFFPLHGKKLEQMQKDLKEARLHQV